MKKLILFVIAAMLIFPAVSTAQSSAYAKLLKKEVKQKKKEFASGGWEIFGSARTIDVALTKHYAKLEEYENDVQQIIGVAPRFSSKNVGHQMAFANAANQYAQMTSGTVKGIVENNTMSDGANTANEVDNFMSSFIREVEMTIKGELEESFSVIREIEPGVYEMQSFYIYNKVAASEARMRALKSAAKESETAQIYAVYVEKALEEEE